MKHLKIGLRWFLRWSKGGLEPKFHEAMTFCDCGNHEKNDNDKDKYTQKKKLKKK